MHTRWLTQSTCPRVTPCKPDCFEPTCNSLGKCWCDRGSITRFQHIQLLMVIVCFSLSFAHYICSSYKKSKSSNFWYIMFTITKIPICNICVYT